MRILAPLLVVLIFVALGLRLASDPEREYERERIDADSDLAAQDPARREALLDRIDRWIQRHGEDPKARWYASRALLRLGAVERSINAIWEAPGLKDAPGTARRFGALLLRNAGFGRDEALEDPGILAGTVAVILLEGGDEQVAAWLKEVIGDHETGGFFASLHAIFLYATEQTRLQVADWLRPRPKRSTRIVAALASMRPDAYPAREDDLALLHDAVQSSLRWQERFVWSTACVALGSSEDTTALGGLVDLRRRLADLSGVNDREDSATCGAGEIAGGWWQASDAVEPYLGARGARTQIRLWYGQALLHRLARGDEKAADAFEALWTSLRARPDPPLEARLATAVLLKDRAPHENIDADGLVASLEARPHAADRRAVAAAYRYRRGEEGSLDRIVQQLREEARSGWLRDDPSTDDRILVSPILTLARALYLYDPSL